MPFNPATLSSQWIKVSEPSPHVLHVQLSREPVNAFCDEFWQAYGELFERLIHDAPDIRAVVVSSALQKFFTAGLDLKKANSLGNAKPEEAGRRALQLNQHIKEFQHAIHSVERFPFPVIIALHGIVFGLGIDMSSSCDIRLAASDATFSIKEVDIGIAADIGTLGYVPKVSGNQSLVREYAYTARRFGASDAEKMGYVSRVIEGGRDEVVREALELAKEIAGKSPIAILGTKRLLLHARDHTIQENLDYTAVWNSGTVQTKDMGEALAATREKRPPKFAPYKL